MVTLATDGDGRAKVVNRLMAEAPLIVAALVLGVPTLVRLGEQVWTHEAGAHGPIVLATGIWLMWRRAAGMVEAGQPGRFSLTLAGTIFSLLVYIAGRAYDLISLESAGVYGFGVMALYSRVGLRQM